MSLATRCTACGTVFRVVQDQLKVSEGWVRCGKCQEVFSAMDGLFDLDLKAAAALPAGTGSGFAPSPAVAQPANPATARAAAATAGSAGRQQGGGTPFDPPLFAPAGTVASMWRGKRESDQAVPTDRAIDRPPVEPPFPVAPILDRIEPPGGRRAFEDDASDDTDALQIQPLDQEEAPFVLRRPAIEARAFSARAVDGRAADARAADARAADARASDGRSADARAADDRAVDRPAALRDLPGAAALRRATEERDSHSETLPATFDRADVDDWRPVEADAELADIATSRGLHIDLLIDDIERPAASSGAVPDDVPPSAARLGDAPRPDRRLGAAEPVSGGRPAITGAAPVAATADSHVLGGTLTDGSLEENIADAADPPPAFLRDAERRSRRDTPRQRQWLIGTAAALAVVFGLQLVFHSRDVLAARFPAMATPLAALCAVTGCTLGPPRRIDDVVVDSSALTRVEGLDAFQLTVVLRNRSTMPLAMPSIDLSLTDTDGQLVSRRALQPADFASAGPALAASGEQTLKLLLSAGERRVTGYTVELFYP